MESLIYLVIALTIVIIILQYYLRPTKNNDTDLMSKLDVFSNSLTRIEINLKDDFRNNREELNKAIADFRTEIMTAVKSMTEQNNTILEKLNQTLEQKVTALIEKDDNNNCSVVKA
jgi:DNA recombination protein RmuC